MRAQRIDAYLRKQRSPLAGLGSTFVTEAQRNGIPPGLLVAIAGAESSFGRITSGANNPFGWGPGISFPSWQAAIGAVARGLRSGYFNEGRTTVPAIGAKWAPSGASNDPTNLNSNWVKNVQKFMRELGGGMPLQAPGSPSNASGGGNIGSGNTSSLPDLSGLAFQNLGQIGMGRYPNPVASLDSLVQSVAAMGSPPASSSPAPVSSMPSAPGRKGSLAELFYDPLGAIKNGASIPAIGGHSDHVHIATSNAQAMLSAFQEARRLGLHIGENPYVSSVGGSHVHGSYHYRNFSGRYNGKTLGQAADISGDPRKMAAFYRWASSHLR